MSTEQLGVFAEGFVSLARVLSTEGAPEARWKIFGNVAREVAGYVSRGLPKSDAVDWLWERAEGQGFVADQGPEAVQEVIATAFERLNDVVPEDWGAPPLGNGHTEPPRLVRSSAEFVAGFVPPDYVVGGILQRRFCYSFTGKTGAGKTAMMLLLAASVALGRTFGDDRETESGRVLYFAGENPDDIRARWIALSRQVGFDIDTIDVHFIPGTFKISEMQARIHAEVKRIGEFALIVIDTSSAYFEGDNENDNKQAGDHARRLRGLVGMRGGPCVLVACHPPKNAGDDNLQPRGGGAFLAEIDGNLTAKHANSVVEVHWQGKFRGPDFAPLSFQLSTVTHERLKDSKGRLLPTVVASFLSEIEQEKIEKVARSREDELLAILEDNKHASQMELAKLLGWEMRDGKPYRVLVGRTLDALKKAKLITFTERDGYVLTAAGKKARPDGSSVEPGARQGTGLPGGLELVGAEPPGTPCAHCGVAYGNVLLIRASGSVRGEALHQDCAAAWYASIANKRNTRRNKSTQPCGKNRGRNK
jgi:AAA domain